MTTILSNGTLSGGSLTPFSPSTLNPDYWRDPSSIINLAKDGANKVSEVFDLAGNSNNATQGNGTQQGIYTPGAINSLSAVNYDGIDDLMETPYLWPLQFHIFMVIRPTRVTGVNTIISSYDGSGGLGNQGEYVFDVRSGSTFLFQAFNLSPPISGAPSGGVLPNTNYLIELRANASKFTELLINNEAIDDGTIGTASATKTMFIAGNTTGTTNTFKGFVGEELGFSVIQTGNARTQLLNYFSRWGV